MRYVGTISQGVIIAKGINYTDYIDENEIELTEEQYNTIQTPCKVVNGIFKPCEYPKITVEETEENNENDTEVSEIEQLRADVDYIAIMTGVEL